jgi:hypothetical protein
MKFKMSQVIENPTKSEKLSIIAAATKVVRQTKRRTIWHIISHFRGIDLLFVMKIKYTKFIK